MLFADAVRTGAVALSSPGVVVLVVFLLLYLGVVLPAVWSRRSQRRHAAARVLELILGQLLLVLGVLAGLLRR
ncbi:MULTISPECIES: hypothetical protein [Streptomyces]|uniref:hypothetical protein n=1 Tax=Streptomyces TaxID=1883 RepID=UPI000978F8F4|nr:MULTISPECIES: hypothetical protein [unclassified Streptomyces]ONI53608.1 hypothetical protein STIB_13090 [Streptomyces sp. IB2014 011-1]